MGQRVPFGILFQVIYPGGRRLPKLPSLMPDSSATAEHDYQVSFRGGHHYSGADLVHSSFTRTRPTTFHAAPPPIQEALLITPDAKGNLSEEAYRFFVGRDDGTAKCQCRGCLKTLDGKELRGKHIRTCKYLVLETLKLLHRDKRCLMCNNHTEAAKWGAPLCSNECRTAWKFAVPVAFHEARRMVLNSNPGLMRQE